MSLDPRYALRMSASANAQFWQYQMSRAGNQPEPRCWRARSITCGRAIELERDLAEAHATLAFLLVSAGALQRGARAARRAVALEPGYWGNQFRLAHAAWGDDGCVRSRARWTCTGFPLRALRSGDGAHRARRPRPRRVGPARRHDRPGSPGEPGQRYPAKGLHWLLGLVRLAQRRREEAQRGVRAGVARRAEQLYAAEFAMNAYDGAGFVALEPATAARAVADVHARARAVPGACAIARRPWGGARRR